MGAHSTDSLARRQNGRRCSIYPKTLQVICDSATNTILSSIGDPEELLGCLRAELDVPGAWYRGIHPDDRAQIEVFCANSVEDRRSYEIAYRRLADRGELRWLHEIAEFEVDQTTESTYRVTIIDITQSVSWAKGAVASHRLDQAIQLIAEEMSRPLNDISGYGDMLARHLSGQGDDVGSDYAVGVREGVQQIRDFLEGLAHHIPADELEEVELANDVRSLLTKMKLNK